MSDCGCDQAKRDLEEYLHNELERAQTADVAEHLAHCSDCSDELHVGVVLSDAVRRACRDTAPEQLREHVITQLRLELRH